MIDWADEQATYLQLKLAKMQSIPEEFSFEKEDQERNLIAENLRSAYNKGRDDAVSASCRFTTEEH